MVVGKFAVWVAIVVAIAISLAASGIHFARRAWMQTLKPSSCLRALCGCSFPTVGVGLQGKQGTQKPRVITKMPILLRAALPSQRL